MDSLIGYLMQWVSAHPHLTGFIVGVIACSEALAFVGLLVPGAALMVAAGVLVGAGLVDFWSIFAWAVGGAVLGDGISYWLGHHYREKLSGSRILRRHSQWLTRGTEFFRRHGGKSIVLARFVGPVRPIIPVIAGMLGMSPLRFYLNNVISALAWAPTHLLVGMAVGASLVIASQVATRLSLVLAIFAVTAWMIIWFVHFSYRKLRPRVVAWVSHVPNAKWLIAYPRLRWLITDLFDPARPPAGALIIWLGMLIASTWLFLGVLEDVLDQDPLVYAGQAIFHFLQQLRTPLGDVIMIGITELGDAAVTLPLAVSVLLYLFWRRSWRDLFYWSGALGYGLVAVMIIKLMLKIPRPVSLYSGADFYSFPSGHATMSTVIYGLLAVYTASSMGSRWRWVVYASAILLIIAIAFSRLYLGAHWLADVTAGLALGTTGVALISIARQRHQPTHGHSYGLLVLAICVLVSAASWHISRQLGNDIERYAIRHPVTQISETDWQTKACTAIAIWRVDLHGEKEQPLNVQWAGDLKSIRQILLSHGWEQPPKLNLHTALSWLLPKPALSQLPVLPQLHDGRAESLVLIHRYAQKGDANKQLILRLWPTTLRLKDSDMPVWHGTVASQYLMQLPLIRFPRLSHDFNQAQAKLELNLHDQTWSTVQCSHGTGETNSHWNGNIILLNVKHP